MFRNGLKKNISELNRLIGLLDRSSEEIIEEIIEGDLNEEPNNSAGLYFSATDKDIVARAFSSNIAPNSTDAARVTEDLDHLLTSLSQYKLNQTSDSSLYNKDDAHIYIYGDQAPNNHERDCGVQITSGRTHAASIPICVRCNELIYDNSICALDGYWHQHHFMCRGCDLRLENQIYYVKDCQPFCETCHINLFTDKCAYCDEPITDTSLTALDQCWHPEHFFCFSCQGPFNDDVGFHEREGKPFCSECYFDLFGQRCGGCKSTITSTFLAALGKKWHSECFVCSDCHGPFESAAFREIRGNPYCELHYHMNMGTICYCCNKPIIGSLVSALGRKYHIDCFKCCYCLRRLAKSSFKESGNRPYCTECFAKLCP